MNIENVTNSYNGAVYVTEESQNKNGCREMLPVPKDSASVAVDGKDAYIHSGGEVYFSTYTSDGVISGEEEDSSKNEKSRILPERYKERELCGKQYYQGNLVTDYELLEIAVKTGAITLDESETVAWNSSRAYEALISSKATPLYSWSTTLYSEDRMYVYRVENGVITGARRTKFRDGTTFQDIADAVASGKGVSEEDKWKLDELKMYDRELYDAAQNIAMAKERYDTFTNMYQNGQLTEGQFRHDCYPLLLLLFGADADIYSKEQFLKLSGFFERDMEDFLENAFANYNPKNQALVDELLIDKRYHSYSGLY